MIDQSRLYVNTSDGMIYRYSGSGFINTNKQYQSTGIGDGTITAIKTDFINISPNLFKPESVVEGYRPMEQYQVSSYNELQAWGASNTSQVFEVGDIKTFSTNAILDRVVFYTENGLREGTISSSSIVDAGTHFEFTLHDNIYYYRLNMVSSYDYSECMVVEGSGLPSTFTRHGKTLSEDVKISRTQLIGLDDDNAKQTQINLPYKMNFLAGEQVELFNWGIVDSPLLSDEIKTRTWGWNSTARNDRILMDFTNITEHTNVLHRFFVRDVYDNEVAEKDFRLNINPIPSNPQSEKNILCIGDSLTESGRITEEFLRRLTTNEDAKYLS